MSTNSSTAKRARRVETAPGFSTASDLAPHLARLAAYLDTADFGANDTRHVLDQKDTLENMLSMLPAGGASGALMQLMVAAAHVDCLRWNDYDKYAKDEKHRQIDRLLYGVIHYFEETFRLDRADLAGQLYAGDHTDPHQRLPVAPLSAALRSPAAAV